MYIVIVSGPAPALTFRAERGYTAERRKGI
jgi:hypothetical protein